MRKDHPLRPIRTIVDKVLKELSREFNKMYSKVGRPSIPPEQLLRALLLQMLYSVRSERLLVEEIHYNILFRWFVGLNLDDAVWDATVFTKNRDRLLEAEVAKDFLALVVEQAREQGWASDEHFTVDGSLLEAWVSAKSFQPKNKKSSSPPDDPGNATVNYRGEKRSSETHESRSDPEAQLARKGPGKEAKLSYSGNLLVENRGHCRTYRSDNLSIISLQSLESRQQFPRLRAAGPPGLLFACGRWSLRRTLRQLRGLDVGHRYLSRQRIHPDFNRLHLSVVECYSPLVNRHVTDRQV